MARIAKIGQLKTGVTGGLRQIKPNRTVTKDSSRTSLSKFKNTKNVTNKSKVSKRGSKKVQDISRRQYKLDKKLIKADLKKSQLELDKVRSNNMAKVGIAGEVSTGVAGTTTGGVAIGTANQQVNGGLSDKGGLGRDDANNNNKPKDESVNT